MCITVKIAEDPCAERVEIITGSAVTRMSHLKANTYSTQVHELRDFKLNKLDLSYGA